MHENFNSDKVVKATDSPDKEPSIQDRFASLGRISYENEKSKDQIRQYVAEYYPSLQVFEINEEQIKSWLTQGFPEEAQYLLSLTAKEARQIGKAPQREKEQGRLARIVRQIKQHVYEGYGPSPTKTAATVGTNLQMEENKIDETEVELDLNNIPVAQNVAQEVLVATEVADVANVATEVASYRPRRQRRSIRIVHSDDEEEEKEDEEDESEENEPEEDEQDTQLSDISQSMASVQLGKAQYNDC